MAYYGRSYRLWGTIFSPLTPERPINTGSSRLRYQDNLSGLLHQGKIRRSNRPQNGISWSKLPPLRNDLYTFEERPIYTWGTIFSPLTPERPINTGSSRLRNQVILSSLLHQGKIRRSNRPKNKKNDLSWSTLPPLAPERPINTGGSRLRNQVILSGLLHQGKFYAWNFSKQLFRYFQIACICPPKRRFWGGIVRGAITILPTRLKGLLGLSAGSYEQGFILSDILWSYRGVFCRYLLSLSCRWCLQAELFQSFSAAIPAYFTRENSGRSSTKNFPCGSLL